MSDLQYRPKHYDDWGMIRNADGSMHATVRRPESHDGEFDQHRVEETDPFADLARKIIFFDDLEAENHRLRTLLSAAEQRGKDARRAALEDLRELLQFTKWTAYVYHCPPPRSKRDNPLKHSSLITLNGSFDSEGEALKAARSAIALGWVGSTIVHRESATSSAQFEIQKGVANSIARLAALERSEG